MDIFLIDGIGPFFRNDPRRKINWSKIPFRLLPLEPEARRIRFDQIAADLTIFAGAVRQVGYNSVSLDDVAHLVPHPWYEAEVNERIGIFQKEFRRLFAILGTAGLAVYLTMDFLSLTPALKTRLDGKKERATDFVRELLRKLFTTFPEVRGVILRVGECDARDVRDDFKSELIVRTPVQLNRLLHRLLPVFAEHGRQLILRTWTVGAYRIGDLIWHRRSMATVLRGIDSSHFILSMKYGETDFFRYLPVNRSFFRTKVKKIIELQARREYEGCGEYPSFTGWDYSRYATELQSAENMVGISVWCQTGGWLPFRRLSYLEPKGMWNELNSLVAIRLFKEGRSVEEAVAEFAAQIHCQDPEKLLEFLRLDDEVIRELLYMEDLASQKYFFRRVRIPPLLAVYWNSIFINRSMCELLHFLVRDPAQCVAKGHAAVAKLERMEALAQRLGLPVEDVSFMRDTFQVLALAREYYFLPDDPDIQDRIRNAKKAYKQKYPKEGRARYKVKTDFSPSPLQRRHVAWFLRLLLRQQRSYRLLDYLFTLPLLAPLVRLLLRTRPRLVPKFARKSAMGIETIFR